MNYNELTGSPLYKAVREWLDNNPGKDIGDFTKETGYTGPELQVKDKKTGRIGLRNRKSDKTRAARIAQSSATMDTQIRAEAAAQWDELVGDRSKTFKLGGKNYSFQEYVDLEVDRHKLETERMATEAKAQGKTLGHGTPTTDPDRYAESYTQQFPEKGKGSAGQLGNFETQDKIPLDQTERLQKAGLATSPQEAAQMHVGRAPVGGRLPDEQIAATLKPGKDVPTVKGSLLSQFSPEQRRQLEAAPDLESKEKLVKQFKSNKGLTAARLARNVAPLALSVPLGIGVAGQSAAAAVQNPTQDNIVNAGFDITNSLADLVGLIPTPLTVGASEAIQRGLMLGQMSYNSARTLQRLTDMKNK
jgi:hypothetical protein